MIYTHNEFDNELLHIEEVMDDFGYILIGERVNKDKFAVSINYSTDGTGQFYRAMWECKDAAAAKRAVKSLLKRTSAYEVTVYGPKANPVTFYGYTGHEWSESDETDWKFYVEK